MDLQIDDFYKDAAGGLLALYQAFPRKIALYVEDLIGREEPDEFGLPSKRHQSCLGALLWLADEGYLRFESTIQFLALDQAVLTEKGFIRLTRAVPDNAGRAPTIVPVWMDFGSLEHRDGYRKAALGVANYERRVREKGLDQPWTEAKEPHLLNAAAPDPDLQITIPSWVKRPGAVADEETELSWRN